MVMAYHQFMNTNTCSCGCLEPHVTAHRETSDGVAVEIWSDGALTGRIGRAIPGVPIARPRADRPASLALTRAAAALISDYVSMHDACELPRLYACARRVAGRGGSPGDMRRAFDAGDAPKLALAWEIYATDAKGNVTARVARLDRIRWPGLVVWHERGRYELLALRAGAAVGSRSREALEDTGFSFASQRALRDYLFSCSRLVQADTRGESAETQV
jgi:hypothetical protein